jgi:hypothetical protein
MKKGESPLDRHKEIDWRKYFSAPSCLTWIYKRFGRNRSDEMHSVSSNTVYLSCSNLVKYFISEHRFSRERNSRTANKARILCLSEHEAPGTVVTLFSARVHYSPRATFIDLSCSCP